MQEYSAGFTSERIVKNEMKIVIQLYLEGKTKEEIRDLVVNDNLFNMRSINSIKETLGKINRRVKLLDDRLMNLYVEDNSNDSSAILLYTFLSSFRIAREFVMEIIYDNWINFKREISIGDVNIFFDEKAKQSEVVSNWSESTTKRIRNRILEFCSGCNLIHKEKNSYSITPIVISKELRKYVEDDKNYSKILTYILME